MLFFWVVTPCGLVDPKDGDSMFLRIVPASPHGVTTQKSNIVVHYFGPNLGKISQTKGIFLMYAKPVWCRHFMVSAQVADGRDSLQMWRVAANQQSRIADKRWSSS
jgi:hypothetical protein